MRERIQRWWHETHGTRFELMRQFLPGLLENGLLPVAADWTRVASGVAAMLVSSWMLLAALLIYKYCQLAQLNLHARIAGEAVNDLAAITALVTCLVVLLIALLWQSLFPALKDVLALAGMPVSGADLFAAKFASVGLVFASLLALLAAPAGVVFAIATGYPLSHALAILTAASSVTFFGLLAVQGVLLQLLPGRLFDRAMTILQALLFAASLAGFPVAAWKGHLLSPWTRIPTAPLALCACLAPAIAAAVYLISYRRYARVLLEAAPRRHPRRGRVFAWIVARLVTQPREQAIWMFLAATLRRSRVHRLALLLSLGAAIAWTGKMMVDLQMDSTSANDWERTVFTSGPLAVLLFALLGMRQLFGMPAELPAVWMFRITEREGRAEWLEAVERFVMFWGIGPAVLLGAGFVGMLGGVLTALAWALLAALAGAIAFELIFRNWCKLPFTCTYVPGKRPLLVSLALLSLTTPALLPLAYFLYAASTNPASFLLMLGIECGLWLIVRRIRRKRWGQEPLRFEEDAVAEVDTFGLAGEGTVVAQEQFAREWDRYIRGGEEEPVVRPLEEGESPWSRAAHWLTALPQDLRHSLRLMFRQPGFAAGIILTLALGLGLNAAFFTIFNAFLLRPLAVRDPGSLVSINFTAQAGAPLHLSQREYDVYAAAPAGFSEVAASAMEGSGLAGRAAHVAMVSDNYFSLLGVGAALGRPLQRGEQDLVLVLSDTAWRTRFGADPSIVGRKVMLNGLPFQVVGVTHPEFAGVNVGTIAIAPPGSAAVIGVDCWVPIAVWNQHPLLPRNPVYGIVGRLAPGVSETRAEALATAQVRRLTSVRPTYDRIFRAEVESLDIPITWTALKYSMPLLMAFGLTMLIPCANAANMMLARGLARQRELGARMALGAGRGRIVRQLLAESFVFSLCAGLAGLGVAVVCLQAFLRLLFRTAPPTLLFRMRIPEMRIDWHVFGYMLLVAVLTTLLFALGPALQATRVALAVAIRGEFGTLRTSKVRMALLISQVSLCVMLLGVAVVLLRGSSSALGIARGYQTNGVFAVANQSGPDGRALQAILQRETWVHSMAVVARPLIELETLRASTGAAPWSDIRFANCSGDFFNLVRIPLVRGRVFLADESDKEAPVVVVSEMAARRLFPTGDPIGQTIRIEPAQTDAPHFPHFREALVIGIVRDVVLKARDGGPRPVLYFPTGLQTGTVLAVRGTPPEQLTASRLEAALARAPGALHGARVVGLQETIDWDTYPQQAASWLSTLLGLVALLLTLTGVYAVMSYLVSQRTKEIGIRMAIGASRLQIARFVLGYSTRSAAIGLAAGLTLALGVLQYVTAQVDWAVDIYDSASYGLVAAVVAVAVLAAAAGPVRRACGLDPQVTLRSD